MLPELELLLPRRCAGCGAPGEVLCARCRTELAAPPQRVSPRVESGVPVWALGPYSETRRSVILAMKERGDRTVRRWVGAVLAAAVATLTARGEVGEHPVLVPAPTAARSARLRGGDPVTDACRATGLPTAAVLSHARGVRDSVGLSPAARRANLAGRVRLRGSVPAGELVLVDDVVTTGATLAAACAKLTVAGAQVRGALAFAAA